MSAPLVPILFTLGFFAVVAAVSNILVGDHCQAMRSGRHTGASSLDHNRTIG